MQSNEFLACNVGTPVASYSNIPILCISASTEDDVKSRAREAGANGWINKPWHPESSMKVLESLIGKGHRLHSNTSANPAVTTTVSEQDERVEEDIADLVDNVESSWLIQ